MKTFTKKIINKLGVSVQKFNPYLDGFYIRKRLIDDLNIKKIIDVGANEGQYAKGIFAKGYTEELYSFEPIKQTFNTLSEAAKKNTNWKVFNYALSNTCGNQEINRVNFSPECSLLERKNGNADSKKEIVTLISFDEWVKKENLELNNFWFKIDVEGYEKFVLEGAQKNLSKAAIVELEVSPLPRFECEDISYQTTLSNMINYMDQNGFDVVHVDNPAHYDKSRPYLCYIDVIFIRNDLKDLLKDLF